MKIKRFKLRDGVTRDELLSLGFRSGGSWIVDKNKENVDIFNCWCFDYRPLDFEFSISIAFRKNLEDWNDFDNILVMDEAFLQPYTPFYGDYYGKDIPKNFKALYKAVEEYNVLLSGLPFLVEVS